MASVYLGLGTNLNDKERNLTEAIKAISTEVGKISCQSTFYASQPWGFESENAFLNAVILVETNLSPIDLLSKTQKIERELGRTPKISVAYSDRIIDIDILFYDSLVLNLPTLKIPHPLIAERDFVMIPFVEIAPDFIHPVLLKSMKELLSK